MKLSIIICVYNTAREYLDECLCSLRHSTLGAIEYEICVVDDGSDIDYTDLVTKWRVRYVKTENRGIFAARLAGIEMAEGEYIAFVDSDDTVSVNYHVPMVECADESGADIVYNDWAFHTKRTRYFCRGDVTVSGDVSADGDDVLLSFARHQGRQHAFYVLWNKIYRRDIMKRIPDEMRLIAVSEERFNYSEDALMNFYLHKWAGSVRSVHSGYYFYRTHEAQSVEVTSSAKLQSQIRQMSFTLSKMQTSIGKNAHAKRISEDIEAWGQLMSRAHYSHARAHGYTELYPYIMERYGVKRLGKSRAKDGSAYVKAGLLGENIKEIDEAIYAIFASGALTELTIPKDKYALRTVSYMIKHGAPISTVRSGDVTLPRERVRLINKILFNPFIRKVGMILFPRGSRIRAALKRVI